MDNHDVSSILHNFPLSLQSCVLGTWLTNADVCKLDSAFCSKAMRPQFLNITNSEVVLLHSPKLTELKEISSWMEWVVKRKVRITACHISSAIHSVLYMSFFKAVGERLTRLAIFANRHRYTKSNYVSMIATAACFCTSLRSIQIQNCECLSSLENLLHACQKSLTVLNLFWCDLAAFRAKDLHLPALKRLVLEQCSGVSETAMAAFLEASPNLEILNCRDLYFLAPTLSVSAHLRVLLLSKSHQFDDEAFCNLVNRCPLLEVVRLSECTQLTDVSVVELAHHADFLSGLYLCENSSFTGQRWRR